MAFKESSRTNDIDHFKLTNYGKSIEVLTNRSFSQFYYKNMIYDVSTFYDPSYEESIKKYHPAAEEILEVYHSAKKWLIENHPETMI